MAFYLKRAFNDTPDIMVLNDLRIEMDGDAAQIDHLIVHRFGFLIVESKSVTTEVSINDFGEWSRTYKKQVKGMPFPINQAIRQNEFLKNYLTPKSNFLLKKKILFKTDLSNFKYDVLVAISDSGIIKRSKDSKISSVYKADEITNEIQKIISSYKDNNSLFKLTLDINYEFLDETMEKISRYLVKSHKPRVVANEAKKIDKKIEPKIEHKIEIEKKDIEIEKEIIKTNSNLCSKCNSKNIQIVYGKYGYYFKCQDCDKNTTIKLNCKDKKCKVKLRKEKEKFYKECKTCNISILYFENNDK